MHTMEHNPSVTSYTLLSGIINSVSKLAVMVNKALFLVQHIFPQQEL